MTPTSGSSQSWHLLVAFSVEKWSHCPNCLYVEYFLIVFWTFETLHCEPLSPFKFSVAYWVHCFSKQSVWVQTASSLLPSLGSGSNVNLVFTTFVKLLWICSMHAPLWNMGSRWYWSSDFGLCYVFWFDLCACTAQRWPLDLWQNKGIPFLSTLFSKISSILF